MTKNNFYITYYARKHQKFITRKGWFDKPDGTKGKSFVSSKGNQCLIYWDLDQDAWRMAVGKAKIKYEGGINQMNRIIKRTNPYSGESEMLTREEAMLHDTVKQAEEMQEYDKMQKALDKFSKLNPKAYMTLLD